MNCLVLGGGGFIGSHICDGLVASGHHVRVFEKEGLDKSNIQHLLDRIQWLEGDFANPEHLRKAVRKIDVVFHLIGTTKARSSNDNPIYDVTSNVIPTLELLDAAHKEGVKKVIFSSSGGTVYGKTRSIPIPEDHPTEPLCSYGIHKLAIEKYLTLYHQLHGLDYAVMRISNPYGERQRPTSDQGAVAVFLYKVLKGDTIEVWGDGSVVRDYLHITDVVRAALKLTHCNIPHKVVNIGSGIGLSLKDILDHIAKVTKLNVHVRYLPARTFDVPVNVLDISRAREFLDWKPEVRFEEGLRRTADYLRKQE